MRKIIIFLVFFIIFLGEGFSQTQYCEALPGEQILKKYYLTISYNKRARIPNYVGYKLTEDRTHGDAKRENYFFSDEDLDPEYRATTQDYSRTGYDRGHMSPAADWKFSQKAMHDSFCLSNICPQNPTLNRRYWSQLEELERFLTKSCDTLYIITGSIIIYEEKINNRIIIPTRFYKTIVGVKYGSIVVSCGWIYNNSSEEQTVQSQKVPISMIETYIGKDLYQGFWFDNSYELDTIICHPLQWL